MRSVALSVLLAVGVATTASGAVPYSMLSIDADNRPGFVGHPFTWTDTIPSLPFIDTAAPGADPNGLLHGNLVSPPKNQMISIPSLQFTTYAGMDAVGPTIPGIGSAGYQSNTNLIFSPANLTWGSGFIGGQWGSLSGGVVASTGGSMFLMNLTLPPTASAPTTTGVFIGVREGTTVYFGIVDFSIPMQLSELGSSPPLLSTNFYKLTLTSTNISLGALRGGPTLTNYTIGLQSVTVPSPAPLAPLAMLGLLGARRRRDR